jgi:hypothetical protein
MEDVGKLYGHLVYFVVIGYSSLPFGMYRSFGVFFTFWYIVPRKIWQPWLPHAA